MKLYIKQSVFTLGAKFTVKNEFGEDAYYIEGSFFRYPKEFNIYNSYHEKVGHIERQILRFFSHYDIKTDKQNITLKREFSFFRQYYSILGIDWSLQGNFTGHHYEVMSGNDPIMKLRKHWFTWGDSYELDIPDHQDEVLALAIAICIDNEILRDSQSNNNA